MSLKRKIITKYPLNTHSDYQAHDISILMLYYCVHEFQCTYPEDIRHNMQGKRRHAHLLILCDVHTIHWVTCYHPGRHADGDKAIATCDASLLLEPTVTARVLVCAPLHTNCFVLINTRWWQRHRQWRRLR